MAIQDAMLLFRQTFFRQPFSMHVCNFLQFSTTEKNATPAACMIYLYTSDDNEMNMCICTCLVHVILLKIIAFMKLFSLCGVFI